MALAAIALLALFVTRTLSESTDQMRAALKFVVSAPRSTAPAEREPIRETATPAALEPEPLAPSPQWPPAPQPAAETAEEPASPSSGPPSGAEFLALVEEGLVPEADAEATAELRRALEEAAAP